MAIWSSNRGRRRNHSSSASSDKKLITSNQSESTTNEQQKSQYNLDFNLFVNVKSLVSLLKQVLCSGCKRFWDGSAAVKERDGLYIQL